MPSIPQEILDISAVVTGAETIRLTGRQRELAIQAMHALGHTPDRIAAALDITGRRWYLNRLAREAGVELATTDTEPDVRAIGYVLQGTPMHLTGCDRDEAIRRLAARGTRCAEIADLLCTTTTAVSTAASRLRVSLPVKEADWWVAIAQPSRSSEFARAYRRRRKQLANA